MAFSAQVLHLTTPLSVQMTQMNVPQSAQGYPSEARSSLPQARQTIASRSFRSGFMDVEKIAARRPSSTGARTASS